MLRCKDCRYWYGAEDDEYGPCSILNQRDAERYITYGLGECVVEDIQEAYQAGELEWAP